MAPAERKEDMRSLSIAQTDGFFFLWEGGGGVGVGFGCWDWGWMGSYHCTSIDLSL